MTNILNYSAIFLRFRGSRKQKQQPLEAETLNFRVLMDCSNQQNLKELKEAISLSVYKINILVIIDKSSCYSSCYYISLALHLEVFQSKRFRISIAQIYENLVSSRLIYNKWFWKQ